MEHQDLLQTIAEVAVTLVGFSGIVATLGRRRKWDKIEIRNLITMLRAGFGAMFLSLLPILLDLYISTTYLWRISISVLVAVMSSNLMLYFWRSRSANTTITQKIMGPPGVVIVGICFLAAIGVIGSASELYILALIWMLLVSAHNFVILLISNLTVER